MIKTSIDDKLALQANVVKYLEQYYKHYGIEAPKLFLNVHHDLCICAYDP